MSQAQASCQPIRVFTALPDPRDPAAPAGARTTVALLEAYFRKIVLKHVENPHEPWQKVFLADQRRALRDWAWGKSLTQEEVGLFEKAIDILGEEMARSLSRPLVLLFKRKYPGAARPLAVWCLLLPCGALAYVHSVVAPNPALSDNLLKTCYFPRCASVKTSEGRWERVARFLIWTYATNRGGRLYPPEPGTEVIQETVTGLVQHRDIRFVTLEQWGFSVQTPGNPWSGRLPDWPDQWACAKKTVPRRLRKRRNR